MKIALEGNCLSLSFSAALQWILLRLKSVYGQLLHFHSSRNWTNLTEELVGPTTRVAKLIWIANYIPIQYSYLLPVLHVEGFWKLQARNRWVLFSFTGVKKHLIFGVILFEVVSFEKDDRRRLFLRDCWMDLFGFYVEEWWMSLCHEFSSR